MSEHERVGNLLPLAAAGALDADEERLVRTHTAGCEECEAALRVWQELGRDLHRLPAPAVPPSLVSATRRRLDAALAAEAGRRWEDLVFAVLALFGWTVSLSMWALFRIIQGGPSAFVSLQWEHNLFWLTATTVLAWLTAGAAAVLVNQRRKEPGRQQ